MFTDSGGTSAWQDFWNGTGGIVVGTAIVVGVAVALTIATSGAGSSVSAALGGGFWGAVAGGAVGGAISGAIIGAATAIIDRGIDNGYANIDMKEVLVDTAISTITGAFMGGLFAGVGHVSYKLSIKDKTWFSRNVKNYSYNSVNFFFGNDKSFTWVKIGHKFRLESSLKHGFHIHFRTTKVRWEPVTKAIGWISGSIGAWIGSFNR